MPSSVGGVPGMGVHVVPNGQSVCWPPQAIGLPAGQERAQKEPGALPPSPLARQHIWPMQSPAFPQSTMDPLQADALAMQLPCT
jgi:hypothetical protein